MDKTQMIDVLMENFLLMNPSIDSGRSEFSEYRKYLEGKSELEIQNIFLINC